MMKLCRQKILIWIVPISVLSCTTTPKCDDPNIVIELKELANNQFIAKRALYYYLNNTKNYYDMYDKSFEVQIKNEWEAIFNNIKRSIDDPLFLGAYDGFVLRAKGDYDLKDVKINSIFTESYNSEIEQCSCSAKLITKNMNKQTIYYRVENYEDGTKIELDMTSEFNNF